MKNPEPMKPLFIPLMSLLLLCGCARQKTFVPDVDDVLAENPELKRVLDHCKDDSLKYRAARFLIANLPYHATNDAPSMDAQLKLYELHSTGKYSPEEVIDSVSRAYGRLNTAGLRQVSDVGISPEYLIENIDWAFKVWREQPWGKNVPFSLFCEYILSYRVGDERLVSWRKEIYERYNPLLDSIRKLPEAEDPRFVSEALFDSLRKAPIHFTGQFEPSPHIGPKTVEWRSGSCKEFTDLLLYVYRAVGLPCAKDIMLMRGNRNAPHSWNVMFDKEGRGYYFTLLDNMTDGANPDAYWDPKGKVYRSTFSLNRRMTDSLRTAPEDLPPAFRYPCMEDVTAVYAGKQNHTVRIAEDRIYPHVREGELLYLCASCRMDWTPLAWCRVTDGEARFHDVEGQMVFRLASYADGKLQMRSDPFVLERPTGEIRFLSPGEREEPVTVFHKFPLYLDGVSGRMIGGVFEGSNDSRFRHADTLFVVKDRPYRLFTKVQTDHRKPYRYVRYRGKAGSHCDVAEIAFYGARSDSLPLRGKVIGTPGDNSGHEYTNAFDGDPYTSFDYPEADGGWTGLDLGKPYIIRSIVYTPRNRDDYIRRGDRYELFYCAGEWRSAGVMTAQSDSLLYQVPAGSLLYLRNHTRGQDERIFEYRDGMQIFW